MWLKIFVLSVLFLHCSFAQIEKLYPSPCHELVKHTYYILSYNETHEQADWVFYLLTKDMPSSKYDRTNFKTDNLVSTGSAQYKDYTNSKFARGHLCPAEDMSWDSLAIDETFYMSNMAPQKQNFNAGIWKKLETKVRNWAINEDSLYVISGGILKPGLKKIGKKNKVSVPTEFFKVIVSLKENNIKGIAFLVPNKKSTKDIFSYAVSIDSLENQTGIDFFAGLPDSTQKQFESDASITQWRLLRKK